MRPLRVTVASDIGIETIDLPPVLDRSAQRSLAPDWVSPTEGNGAGLPRADLHIALVVRSAEELTGLANRIKVVQPPLFNGKVHLHFVINHDANTDDVMVRQAMVDLGWADARDLDIGPPASITEGYPSGTTK